MTGYGILTKGKPQQGWRTGESERRRHERRAPTEGLDRQTEKKEKGKDDRMNVDQIRDALEGHGILAVETAQKVCAALKLEVPKNHIMYWSSQTDALERLGFFASHEGPGEGIDSLDLSYELCKQLGIEAPGQAYNGRGYQGQANTRAILQECVARGIIIPEGEEQ